MRPLHGGGEAMPAAAAGRTLRSVRAAPGAPQTFRSRWRERAALQARKLSQDPAPSAEQLMQFLYGAPIGMVQTDAAGQVQLMTPMAAQLLLGIAPDDTLENLFTALSGPFPALKSQLPRLVVQGAGVIFGPARRSVLVGAGARAARTERWISLSMWRFESSRLMAHISDVTAIVLAEAAAARESAREIMGLSAALAHAVEVAGMGTCTEDLATGRVEWSQRLLDMLGLRSATGPSRFEALVGAFHPDDRAVFVQDWCAARSGTSGPMRELRCLRANGEVGHVIGRHFAELDERGAPRRVTAFYLNISELRAADQQRRVVAEQLVLATQAASLGTFRMSRRGAELVFDPQARCLLGDGQPDGPQPAQLVDTGLGPEGAARFRAWLADLRQTDLAGTIDIEVQRPGAPPVWLAVRGRSQVDPQARSSIKGVIWDATEHHLARQAIAAQQLAEASNRAKSVFLARISHDLRTPLNGILGICDLLRRPRADAEPATRECWLRLIDESGRHLLTLITDLLDLARADVGELKLRMESVDLYGAMEAVCNEQTESARQQRVHLSEQRLSDQPAWIVADRTRLRQVLSNLLSNAVKYNRPAGSVLLQSEHTDGRWLVRVIDSGIGIRADQQAFLCEPFNRLGQDGGAVEGIGLGLSITKQLVELMGARLTCTSSEGLGSTFTVEFLAAEKPEGGSA